MSKRITLTDFEIEQLQQGVLRLKNETSRDYEVIKVGRRFYDALLKKLGYVEPPKPESEK